MKILPHVAVATTAEMKATKFVSKLLPAWAANAFGVAWLINPKLFIRTHIARQLRNLADRAVHASG